MAVPPDSWRLPPPDLSHLSEGERQLADRVHGALKAWLDESLGDLHARVRERVDGYVQRLKAEYEELWTEELRWQQGLEQRLREIERFELEYGHPKTADESRALFRDVLAHVRGRDRRFEDLHRKLDDVPDAVE